MKHQITTMLKILPLAIAAVGFTSCKVDKTQEGNLPEVEVHGETTLPKYDVDAPDVDVKSKKVEVSVPSIEVTPADEDTNDN